MSTTWIIVIAVAIVLLIIIMINNSLVGKNNQVINAFAGIDAYLKKRYDLIPNLVATVQQYMGHEKSVLTEITALRTQALNTNLSPDEKIDLSNKLNKALHSINVAVENYPELKANTNFLQLQASMNEIEEQLSASRRAYNAAINSYNNAVQMFPTNIIAGIKGMKAKASFEALETERQNVNVKDLFNK
jgi:LemA protein